MQENSKVPCLALQGEEEVVFRFLPTYRSWSLGEAFFHLNHVLVRFHSNFVVMVVGVRLDTKCLRRPEIQI